MENIRISVLVFFISTVVFAQYTAIPDSNFEQALIDQGIDTEGTLDGQVLTNDINTLTHLDVSYLFDITDLTGIEGFTALENLNFDNNYVSEIVLSSNTNLKILNCNHNELTTLDVSNNLLLEELYCGNPAIDVGPFNQLASLDLGNNINLEILECIGLGNLTELDLVQNVQLETLNVNFCSLTTLNLAYNQALKNLVVAEHIPMSISPNSNQIQSLDLSNNPALEILWVEDSIIEELNLKNGANNIGLMLHAEQNPNLFCVTVDDATAANAGDYPYSEWHVDPQVYYSENCTIGIDNFYDGQIAIYPNPFMDFLYVENANDEIIKIEILDLLGKTVRTKTKDFNIIDLSAYKPGVYFVKIFVRNAILTKKIIKK